CDVAYELLYFREDVSMRLFRLPRSGKPATRIRRAPTTRPPQLEALEDRSLPSVNFQALAFLGDPAPGTGSGGSLTHTFDWEPGGLNNSGQMVFGSAMSPVSGDAAGANDVGEGVFLQERNGQRFALARVGDTAPDGATYGPNFFGEITLNNKGDGVFSFERLP